MPNILNIKRIVVSLALILFVGAVVVGATGAFFSDTETSSGNTFTAGAIDLQIDNDSYYNGVFNQGTSWEVADLDDTNGPAQGLYLFFDFDDLKPGDYGEDTISIHVDNNDSYACVDTRLDSNDDNGLTEPEEEDGDSSGGVGEGELANAVEFLWWVDDGDNVLEDNEQTLPSGPLGVLNVGEVNTQTLAAPNNGGVFAGALTGEETYYIGKAWCFGDIDEAPVAQDGFGDEMSPAGDNDGNQTPGQPTDGGFTCNGSGEDNQTQTDSLTATISFYAEQSRNNDSFTCQTHLEDEQDV